jgi:hypothetical protein
MSVLIGGSPVRLRNPPRRAQKEIFVCHGPGPAGGALGDPRRPSFSVDLKVSQATRSTYAVRYAAIRLFPSTQAVHRAGVQLRIQSRSLDRESPDTASQDAFKLIYSFFALKYHSSLILAPHASELQSG